MSRAPSRRRVWLAPASLGLLTAVGLVSALLADGLADVLSWAALSAPLLAALWYSLWPAGRRR